MSGCQVLGKEEAELHRIPTAREISVVSSLSRLWWSSCESMFTHIPKRDLIYRNFLNLSKSVVSLMYYVLVNFPIKKNAL